MPEQPAWVAEQFDNLEQQREAVTLGMWIFLATEILFFGGLFLGFFVYRASYPEIFTAASRHLHVWLGTLNTAILLTSSLTIALAVHAARVGRRRMLIVFLGITFLLGAAFLGIKAIEYIWEFQENLMPFAGLTFHFEGPSPEQARIFFSFYFVMTGLHALHLLIGLGVIGVMIALAGLGLGEHRLERRVEMTGLYWHFVDLVWVFLFPIVYLISL